MEETPPSGGLKHDLHKIILGKLSEQPRTTTPYLPFKPNGLAPSHPPK